MSCIMQRWRSEAVRSRVVRVKTVLCTLWLHDAAHAAQMAVARHASGARAAQFTRWNS